MTTRFTRTGWVQLTRAAWPHTFATAPMFVEAHWQEGCLLLQAKTTMEGALFFEWHLYAREGEGFVRVDLLRQRSKPTFPRQWAFTRAASFHNARRLDHG